MGKNANRTVGLSEVSGPGPGDHLRDALLVPVCRPVVAVIHREGEAACPPSQSRKLPTSKQGVGNAGGVAGEALALSEWQLGNPVGIDLVSGVEIGDSATPVRIKGIGESSSGRSDVAARCPAQTRCSGSDVDRLGIRIVEVKLQPAKLLPQSRLQRVVIRFSDGA